jgi:hypothetical protein
MSGLEVSPDVVAVDLSRVSTRTSCSWNDLGWRSVLLRRFENAPVADDVYHSPVKDQLLVLVTHGRTHIESWSGAKWRKAEYQAGSIGMTAPGRETRLRWRTDSPDPHTVLHLYLPGKVIHDAASAIWGAELRPNVFPDTLVTSDPVVQALFQGITEAAASGLDDMYAESAAAFLAVHLLRRHAGMPHVPSPQETDWRVQRAIEFMHSPSGLSAVAWRRSGLCKPQYIPSGPTFQRRDWPAASTLSHTPPSGEGIKAPRARRALGHRNCVPVWLQQLLASVSRFP